MAEQTSKEQTSKEQTSKEQTASRDLTELISRYRAGEPADMEALYLACRRELYERIRQIVKSHQDTEDLLHDTILVALRESGSLKNPEQFRAWIRTIAENLAFDWIRRRRLILVKEDRKEFTSHPDIQKMFSEEDPKSQTAMYSAEQQEDLRRSLLKVPLDCRLILVLKGYADMQDLEIAQALGIAESTVKKRVQEARQILADEMGLYISYSERQK